MSTVPVSQATLSRMMAAALADLKQGPLRRERNGFVSENGRYYRHNVVQGLERRGLARRSSGVNAHHHPRYLLTPLGRSIRPTQE